MKWAKYQPKNQDVILICVHLARNVSVDSVHWYAMKIENGVPEEKPFRRPDGSTGKAKWACICCLCHSITTDSASLKIGGEKIWIGNEPVIPEPTTH